MCMCGGNGMCGKCHAGMKLITGALVLLNALVWPKWLGIDGWITFAGALLVLGGLVKLARPSCGHLEMPSKKKS